MSGARRSGLGRGIGALIPTGPPEAPPTGAVGTTPGGASGPGGTPAPPASDGVAPPVVPAGTYLAELGLDAIVANAHQPRTYFDDDALAELVASITAVGLLQPVVVRPRPDGAYELVMGERRWRAARLAGLAVIPAIVRETDDDAMLRDALVENLHRQQLNPLEEAAAYQQLLTEFGVTHEHLAATLGRSRPAITNSLRLLGLPLPVQQRLAAGVLSAGHGRALLALDDAAAQEELAGRIVAEGLSVRSVEELVAVHAPARSRTSRTASAPDPRFQAVADRLTDRLDTRVRLQVGRAKGKLTIEFAGPEDLDRILAALGLP